jgi:hypothetical protein
MASRDIVFPEELQSAEENPSRVSYRYPQANFATQSRIGFRLDLEERKLAEFYLAEAQRLAHIGSWVWQDETSYIFQRNGTAYTDLIRN